MDSIERLVRERLSDESQNSPGHLSEIQSFCETVGKPTLNLKVREALAFRKQGHFDKAMLNIAEANRDQVIALRKIQALMGQVRGESYPEVVFEKFRQFEPFEIGIADADAVLSILAGLDDEGDPQFKDRKSKLHDCELRNKDAEDYLSFLEDRLNGGSASEEIDETKKSIAALAREAVEIRTRVLERIFAVVDEALKGLPPGMNRDRKFLELSRHIFLVVTSPILTKPAKHVATGI